MKLYHALLAAVAAGAVFAPAAHAAEGRHGKTHAHAHAAPAEAPAKKAALKSEVDELKAEVAALREEIRATRETTAATQTQVVQAQAQVGAQIGAMHQEIAAKPVVTKDDVKHEIATAVEAEHHRDSIPYKGIKITPGGFIELAGMYRSHFQGTDVASNWAIPFGNAHNYYTPESRFSARQSRVSMLVQGKPNEHTTLTMYGELDFLGGAQTANSNESNSFNPRIRHMYAAVDWDHGDSGIHLLAGQTWSLVTLNAKGITPRNEAPPLTIEAQYVPGFAWARQPQVRLTGDFLDHHLWLAVSAENAATTFGGSVPSTVTNTVGAGSGFDAANSLSLNNTPDFVQKAAYEGTVGGRTLHVEGFAIERTATARLNGMTNVNKGSMGFGGSIAFQVVPQYLDVQFSAMSGKGIGRYGSVQLPDVTFDADGTIHPVRESILLAGAVAHPTKMLDIYGYAGEEYQSALPLTANYGIGNLAANDSGCFTEGGSCGGNARRVRQVTLGLWQKIYSGSFGRAQVGAQYSYTQRDLFISANSNGVPQTDQSIGMISFRYYPF
jgi:outer membrane murein-binding lipoprotein Lpp